MEAGAKVKAETEMQKGGKQGICPTHETKNCTSKEWPIPDERKKYPRHLFKRTQSFTSLYKDTKKKM